MKRFQESLRRPQGSFGASQTTRPLRKRNDILRDSIRGELGEKQIMTTSSRLIGLIMTAVLWSSVAVAQDLTPANPAEDLPPALTLPLGAGAPTTPSAQPGMAGEAPAGEIQQADADGYYNDNCQPFQPNLHGFWTELAPIESTGTWLRRGFWYVETDAVVFDRIWRRKDERFAAQDINVNNPPVSGASIGFNPIFLDTNRVLILNGGLPGEDAAVRATLGNFLFRDSTNRDHSLEFTVLGGANWDQNRAMSSDTPHGLFVPFFIDGGNKSFDASTRQTMDYTSNLTSFEMNYHVQSRLGHDQLIMDPNGEWHRAANGGFEREYLVGIRMLQLAEKLDWRASDIINQGDDGRYLIHTDNNLIGLQLGSGLTYQAPRWSIGTTAKGGAYVNDALGQSQLNYTADDLIDFDQRLRENEISFVGEFRVQGRYQILPNCSLRAAYEIMLISAAALAPNQATFITDTTYLNTTGHPFYQGASFGCEFYW